MRWCAGSRTRAGHRIGCVSRYSRFRQAIGRLSASVSSRSAAARICSGVALLRLARALLWAVRQVSLKLARSELFAGKGRSGREDAKEKVGKQSPMLALAVALTERQDSKLSCHLVQMKESRISFSGNPADCFARSLWLRGDPVGPGGADFLADHGDSVLFGQRSACAHECPRGMNLPPEPGHDLFERRAFGSPEHLGRPPDH